MQYVNSLRWAIIGGLCLLPFLAFLVANGNILPSMFFPFITGKNFAFRFLIEILLALYVILAIREPKYRPTSSWILFAVGGFVAWMGVATIFSVDPIKSFWSNFERMEGYVTLLHYFALFIIAGAMFTAEKWWDKFFQVAVSSGVLMAIYSLLQAFHLFGLAPSSQSGPRADGTFGNATYLAVYMLISAFLTLFMMAKIAGGGKDEIRRSRGLLTFYAIALVLETLGLFFTETRGAALGLVGGLIIAALYIVVRGRGGEWALLRKLSIGVLAAVVVFTGLFFAFKDTSVVRNTPMLGRLASISLNDPTTMSRFSHIWPMAVEGAMERPVTGWGQENFSFVFNEHYAPEMYNQEQWFDRAHNQFLDWLVAGGIPAFLLYLSLYVLAALAVIRSRTLSVAEAAVLVGLIAAYAFNNLFVFDNLLSGIYFFIILAFAHSLSRKELPGFLFLSKPGNDRVVAIVAPVVAVVALGGAYMLNVPAVSRATTMIDGLQSVNPQTGQQKDPSENLAAFKQALTYGNLGKQENVEQLYQFASNAIAPSSSVSPTLKEDTYTTALAAGEALLAQRPGDARLELFTGVFLAQFGKYDAAISHLHKALEYSPNKQQLYFQLGATYLQKGDTEEALVQFKKAYDLIPAYDDARVFYAMGLYYNGKIAEGDALLKEKFNTVLVDDNRLVQAYQNLKMFDRVVGIWNARIEKSPNDPQLYLGLATAYFTANDMPNTVATLRKVAQMDPNLAAQVQQLITQIENGTLKP